MTGTLLEPKVASFLALGWTDDDFEFVEVEAADKEAVDAKVVGSNIVEDSEEAAEAETGAKVSAGADLDLDFVKAVVDSADVFCGNTLEAGSVDDPADVVLVSPTWSASISCE